MSYKVALGRPERPFYRVECGEECGWGSLVTDAAAVPRDVRKQARREAIGHTKETGHTTYVVRVVGWYEVPV